MLDKNISKYIKSRKTVYPIEFNGDIINDDVVMNILRNTNYAPSHKLTQPWIFKVFSSKSKNKLLAEIVKRTQLTDLKKDKLVKNFKASSHIICICMRTHNNILPEWEEVAATAMAVQNLWLSLVGSNIGGYWSTPSYKDQLTEFLLLNKNEKCLGFFYLGTYDSTKKRNINRKSIEESVEWYK